MRDQFRFFRPLQGWLRRYPILAIFPLAALMLMVGLACQLTLGGPQPPAERTPVVPANANQGWQTLLQNAKPGQTVDLTLTEGDLTSILAAQLQNNSANGVTVRNPRVVLTNGAMDVYGQAITSSVTANFKTTLNVTVDSQGKPHLQVVSADFGNIPVPSGLRQSMSDMLDRSLSDAISPVSAHFRVNNATISDGYMTINGTVEQ